MHVSVRKVKLGRDQRGDISCGMRGKLKSLDYFRVEDFPEVAAAYGLKPDRLIIYFPPGRIQDYFYFNKGEWNKNKKRKRVCDGVKYEVMYRQQINGIWREPGKDYDCECETCGCECKANVSFTAYVAHPETLNVITHIPIRFRTTSESAGYHLLSNLELRENQILGLPWILSVKMVEVGDKKFPAWNIEPGKHRNAQVVEELAGIAPLELQQGDGVKLLGTGEADNREVMIDKYNEIVMKLLVTEDYKSFQDYSKEVASWDVKWTDEYKAKIRKEFADKKKEFIVPEKVDDIIGKETTPLPPSSTKEGAVIEPEEMDSGKLPFPEAGVSKNPKGKLIADLIREKHGL